MNLRYELAPQLELYDKIGIEWIPHLMFIQTRNFRSEIVNTDCYGLRFNEKPNLNQSIFNEKITGKNKKKWSLASENLFLKPKKT